MIDSRYEINVVLHYDVPGYSLVVDVSTITYPAFTNPISKVIVVRIKPIMSLCDRVNVHTDPKIWCDPCAIFWCNKNSSKSRISCSGGSSEVLSEKLRGT